MKTAALASALIILILSYWYTTPRSVSSAEYNLHIKDKVILLCGTGVGIGDDSWGIGEQLAYELAKKGAKLMLVSKTELKYQTLKRMAIIHGIKDEAILQVEKLMIARTESKLTRIKERALSMGSPQVEVMIQDFGNISSVHDIVDNTISLLGSMDYLVLNHEDIARGGLVRHKIDTIIHSFSVNVLSYVELVKLSLPHVQHVYITSSILGSVTSSALPIYSASKHMLESMFRGNDDVTIGEIGEVLTADREPLFNIPNMLRGDLVQYATNIMDSLITRPKVLVYPRMHCYLARVFSFFS